jgi:endoglucanase Acf2
MLKRSRQNQARSQIKIAARKDTGCMKKKNKRLLILLGLLCVLSLILKGLASANFMPKTIQPPSRSTNSHNLTPIASNQWYSNIYAQFPTQPFYALPAAFQLSPQGVGVSLPNVTKTANTIFAPYIMDVRLGFSNPLQKPSLNQIGDWSIQLSMATMKQEKLSFTLAHGVPFTVFHASATQLQLTCGVPCAVYLDNVTPLSPNSSATAKALSLVVRGHTYILVFDSALPIRFSGSGLTISNATRVFLGILDTRDHYSLFKNIASTEIVDTVATPQIDGNQLKTTYTATTSGTTPLITLYPHQSSFLATQMPVLGTYATIRGTLSLVQTNSFTTSLPVEIPATSFPKLATIPSALTSTLISESNTFIQQGPPGSKDYFLGVWFGRGSNLLLLAHTLGLQNQEQQLLRYLEANFTKSMSYFAYDPAKTSVIAKYPEFGNENLNDHHFHYGYYIRTAAVLGQLDPAFVSKVQVPINLMVADIATTDRQSEKFPYLRTFDIYEGHSWADGFAKFADGNNQESSSEAIQAWYSLYLWSQVTHNASLRSTALYLYTTEIQSVKEYWFGLNGFYTAPYRHAIASIVWGGKVDFATWFSGDPNDIYGIQLLPFSPGSAYLGQLPDIAPYFADLQALGGGSNRNWGDLLLMWKSYYYPDQALAQKESVPVAGMNSSRSLFLYMLYAHAQHVLP